MNNAEYNRTKRRLLTKEFYYFGVTLFKVTIETFHSLIAI